MKTSWLFFAALAFGVAACTTPKAKVQHREVRRLEVADPQPPVVVLTPSSNRPISRVYNQLEPGMEPEDSGVPPRVIIVDSPGDTHLSDAIRRLFDSRPTLAMQARNVRISEREGNILLEGWVDTLADEQLLREHLARLPGVNMIDSRLTVGPPR